MIRFYPVARTLGSFILPDSIIYRPGSGGTFNPAYCYSVWLRHLHYLFKSNLINSISELQSVAEIGPGDSLGIGMAAIYSGIRNYYAFDVLKHANIDNDKKINSELVKLFKDKVEIPHGKGFEATNPPLDNYSFPNELSGMTSDYFDDRFNMIKMALEGKESEVSISYVVPWTKKSQNAINNLDLIFSQAVMEHVEDIHFAYKEMYKWLKIGGIISHQVDFKAHEMTDDWNGHFFINEKVWKFLLKGRKYPINRLPLSVHLNVLNDLGFNITNLIPVTRDNSNGGKKTKVNGVTFEDRDLITSSALIQAVKVR